MYHNKTFNIIYIATLRNDAINFYICSINIESMNYRKINNWVYQQYEKDSFVEHKGKYYIAVEEKTTVEPSDVYASWLYVRIFL